MSLRSRIANLQENQKLAAEREVELASGSGLNAENSHYLDSTEKMMAPVPGSQDDDSIQPHGRLRRWIRSAIRNERGF